MLKQQQGVHRCLLIKWKQINKILVSEILAVGFLMLCCKRYSRLKDYKTVIIANVYTFFSLDLKYIYYDQLQSC